ncbi:IS110 family transposase [Variovorax sp. J22R24]|uniref:IS110 family transposase n=1 Tax=Variovorax gracilis TaxID=3053502 RepID=UPI0025771992|nr:IS110 family transposase [Variovorax sp. J22R24]MDM0108122.1 IS110 family transposase [Variovorax sp. J22R24]
MDESIKFFVGLDAHKDSIAVAVCEAGREPSRFVGTLRPDVQVVLKALRKYGPPRQVSVVYEAGPTGYGLYRALSAQGYRCEVIAPSLVPRRAGERIKTDRRDCARLAELSRAGELKAIWVPDEAHEAMRNLWRAREDAVNLRLKARQQLKAFLLRHERRYPGKTSWTKMHERWITLQRFDHPADQIALTEYQLAAQGAHERVQRLGAALAQGTKGWRFEAVVAALRALRGIDTVSSIGLVCEIGDIHRFASARQRMGYLGLVPSEHSSGGSVRRGSITKTGNAHARRLLTEAAWNYRFPARMSQELRDRSKALPPRIRTHAWKAQVRLCARFARLSSRGVQANKVCVAVARELTGFIWAIAQLSAAESTSQQ